MQDTPIVITAKMKRMALYIGIALVVLVVCLFVAIPKIQVYRQNKKIEAEQKQKEALDKIINILQPKIKEQDTKIEDAQTTSNEAETERKTLEENGYTQHEQNKQINKSQHEKIDNTNDRDSLAEYIKELTSAINGD
jgi:septal ring factor EnvC (AmiA/AmiB activator)